MTSTCPPTTAPARGQTARSGAPGPLLVPFEQLSLGDGALVGGKNASLGTLIGDLSGAGIEVPTGFALTAPAFRLHLEQAGLSEWIYRELDQLDPYDVAALARTGHAIRERVRAAALPEAITTEIATAYLGLSRRYGEEATDVAVRSSATAEDLPSASFAGQHESYLNIRGLPALLDAVRSCMASLFTDRGIV